MKTIILLALYLVCIKANALNLTQMTIDPSTVKWVSNCTSIAGGTSSRTAWSVNRVSVGLRYNQIYNSIYFLNPCAGSNYLSSFIRLIIPTGTNASEVNNNFISTDYVERGTTRGMTSDGSTKYTDVLFNPVYLNCSATSFSMYAWCFTTSPPAATKDTMGNYDGSNLSELAWANAGADEIVTISCGSIACYGFYLTASTGLIGGGTSGSSSQQLYVNGSPVGTAGTAGSTFANNDFFCFAANSSGTAAGVATRRLGERIVAMGFTAKQNATLYAILSQYEIEMLVP